MENRVLILGGDKRFYYLQKYLYGNNFLIVRVIDCTLNELKKVLKEFKYILLPLPLTKNSVHINGCNIKLNEFLDCDLKDKQIFAGAIKKNIKIGMDNRKLNYIDYYENKDFCKLNAIPTSEGAIQIIINNTEITICNSNILITGYGNVAKDLALRLKSLGANVFISARNKKQREDAKQNNFTVCNINEIENLKDMVNVVVNTPNAYIFDKKLYESFSNNVLFLDLASSPGGFSFNVEKHENIVVERGLPSKVAPKTSGEYIAKIILKYIKECELCQKEKK